LLKYQLLEEVFAMKGNQDLVKNKEIRVRFVDYIEFNGSDPQIEDGLRLLDAFAIEFQKSNLEVSSEICAPMYDRLLKTDQWDLYDVRLLAATIGYARTFTRLRELAEKALEKLEEHSHEERYIRLKLVIHVNSINRMLRAKYFDCDNLVPSKELDEMFNEYVDEVMSICNRHHYPVHKAVTVIRMGLFYQNNNLANEGFEMLSETGAEEVYRMMKEDAEEFSFFTGIRMSKKQLNLIIGDNVRKKRREFGMTLEDVSKALNLTNANIGFIERGERGATSYNLLRLSHLFGVNIDYFYTGVEAALPPEIAHRKAQLKKLDSFVKGLSDSQLDFMITMAKNLSDVVSAKS